MTKRTDQLPPVWTLDRIKAAFIRTILEEGDLWTNYLGSDRDAEYVASEYWEAFIEHLTRKDGTK
jgi:hypothetical protein